MDYSDNSKRRYKYKPLKLWNIYYVLLFISSFLLSLCMTMYNATFALYIEDIFIFLNNNHTNGSTTATGVALAAFTFMAIIARIYGGRIFDKNDSFKITLIGLIIMCVPSFFYNAFPIIGIIILLRLFQGGGFSLAHTGHTVAVCEVLPAKKLSEGISYFGLGLSLALAIGPLLGLKLCEDGNYSRIFNVSSIALLVSIACICICYGKLREQLNMEAERKLERNLLARYKNKGLWKFIEKRSLPAAITNLMLAVAVSFIINYIPLFASKNGIGNVGLFFLFEAITTLMSRILIGKLITKYSPFVLTIPAVTSGISAFLLILLSNNTEYLFLISGALLGIAVGFIQTIYNVVAIRAAPSERRGVATSTFFLMLDVGIGGGGLMWGLVIDFYGFTAALLGCIASLIVLIIISGVSMRSPKYLS